MFAALGASLIDTDQIAHQLRLHLDGVFWGDYTGLAAFHGSAHPAWSDTRTPELVACSPVASARPGS